MAKGKNCILVILCLLTLSGAFGQRTVDTDSIREKLAETYLAEVGTREATGNNDGQRIEEYIASTGLNAKGQYPWCAAFVYWVYLQNEITIPTPTPAWSPSYFTQGTIIWEWRGRNNQQPLQGDVIGMYYTHLGRIGHMGFFHRQYGDYFITVEGNTNAEGSREGNQVAIRKRRKIQIRYVARFVK
jgi:hypothetical protein